MRGMMNRRVRVSTALEHEEPDRLRIDLGGTVDTTINVAKYCPSPSLVDRETSEIYSADSRPAHRPLA